MPPGGCNLGTVVVGYTCRKAYKQLVLPRLYKRRGGDTRMSDFEILMLVFTVIGMFLAFYKQGRDDSKK